MLKLIERSSTPVLSLSDAVRHLRRDDILDDDPLIEKQVRAATAWAENFTGRAFIDQTWDYYLDAFPTSTSGVRSIFLPKPPLIEVLGVFGSGVAFTDYLVDYATPSIYLASTGSWPAIDTVPNSVRIRFRSGYVDETGSPGPEGEVPEDIIAAIAIYTATLYENRELGTLSRPAWGAEELLRQYRFEKSFA